MQLMYRGVQYTVPSAQTAIFPFQVIGSYRGCPTQFGKVDPLIARFSTQLTYRGVRFQASQTH